MSAERDRPGRAPGEPVGGQVTRQDGIGDLVDRFRAVVEANVAGTVDLLARVEALVRRAVAERPASPPAAADALARLVDAGLSSYAEVTRHVLALVDGLVSVAERAVLPPEAGNGEPDPGQEVVLVDDDGHEVGRSGKLAAHAPPGQLHRAVSVFVFSPAGELLLQRRAPVKYHFAGRWSNTCCGHPRPGETVVGAGRRRLADELGMDCELVEVATFRYEAHDEASGLVERELDHLLVGVAEAVPDPRPDEVDAVRWVEPSALVAAVADDPSAYTPWLPGALGRVIEARRAGA